MQHQLPGYVDKLARLRRAKGAEWAHANPALRIFMHRCTCLSRSESVRVISISLSFCPARSRENEMNNAGERLDGECTGG
jgi:hypothetical protein